MRANGSVNPSSLWQSCTEYYGFEYSKLSCKLNDEEGLWLDAGEMCAGKPIASCRGREWSDAGGSSDEFYYKGFPDLSLTLKKRECEDNGGVWETSQ